MKNVKAVSEFVDRVIGNLMSAWGCFTVLFVICIPFILIGAAVKWLFLNGYIG
jgi:hypothetical protein